MNFSLWLRCWRSYLAEAARRKPRRAAFRTSAVPLVQPLESRCLLTGADCLGQIEGTTFHDIDNDGVVDAGEALSNAVDAVVVHLFEAGVNGTLESAGNSGVAVGDDVLIGTALPDASGFYQFTDLAAGTYYAEQPAIAGFLQRSGGSVSSAIVISAADAQGTGGTVIDAFDAPATPQVATANSGTPSGFSAATVSVLGGERDLVATHASGGLNVELSANAVAGTLALSSGTGTSGSGVASWDGSDGSATLDPDGLGGVDLTDGGNSSGLLITRSGDAVGSLTVTIHSDATRSSSTTATIPIVEETIFLPYASFTSGGTPADFSSVGAVEIELSGPAGFDGQINLFQTHGPTIFTASFLNYEPLTLGGTVFGDADNSGAISGVESGIDGVALTLFADTNGSGDFEAGQDLQVTDATSTATTSGGGQYAFTNLFPGDYLVVMNAANFSGVLSNFVTSTGNDPTPDPDNDTDSDDNGLAASGAIASRTVTLAINDEPVTDGDADNNTNLTLDFGVLELVDIALSKTDSGDPVTAGSGAGNLTYTIEASNTGPSDATSVQVTDPLISSLPTGWTLVSATGSGTTSFNPLNGVWAIGDLASAATATLTITLTVGSSAAAATTTNTAFVSSVGQTEVTTTNNAVSETTQVVRLVDIAVTKSDNVDPVTAGSGAGNLVYTVTATNNGPSDASGVQITDAFVTALPAGWTLVSGSGNLGSTFQTATGLWNIGDLAAGDSRTLTLTLTVGNAAATGTVTNSAAVTAVTESESTTTNNVASENTVVARLVDIQVFKSDNADPVVAGSGSGNLIYSVTVTNNGPSDATGVTVTDALVTALPSGWALTGTSSTGSTSFSAVTGLWTVGNLPNGDSETLTLTITVDNTASPATVTNTAVVSGVTEAESTTANNSVSETTAVQRLVDIEVIKTDNADPLTAGSGTGNLIYTIEARNNGPSNATGVQVTDALMTALPLGWTLDSAVGSGVTSFNTTTGVWSIGDLADGITETLTLTLTVDGRAVNGTVSNTAAVTGVNETETTVANNTARQDTTIARVVDIELTKSDNVDPVIAGSGPGNLVYTITATNNGPSDATSVDIQDAFLTSLPADWSFVGAVGEGGTTYSPATGIWNAGSISASASKTLTVTLTVGSSAVEQTITNSASVIGVDQVESTTANNVASETTEVQRIVDISLQKTDNVDPVIAGSGAGNLVYTVTATNNGPSDATGISVNDAFLNSLPTGWTLDSGTATGGTTFDMGTSVWTIGALAAGDSRTLTLTLTVDDTAASGQSTNVVTVFGTNESDSDVTNNTAAEDTLVARNVDIALTKTDTGDPVLAGGGTGNLTYDITATNNGPSNATGLLITEALLASLPTGWQLVSATPSGSSTFDSFLGIWDIGQLNQGDTESLSITLTVGPSAAAGIVTNSVTVTRVNEVDQDTSNDTATEDTTVQRRVDVGITKTDSSDSVIAGSGTGNLTWTFTASNAGPSDASGVEFTDALIAALPAGWSFESAATATGSFSESTGVWSIPALATGDTATLDVTVTVGSAAIAQVASNTVTLTAINEIDTSTTNNSATETTSISRSVDIQLSKTDNVDPVASGSGIGNLTYTVSATNAGPSDASAVSVTDPLITSLPTGWRLESATGSGSTTFSPTSGVWTIGVLPSGSTQTLTLTLTVDSSAAIGTTTNTASVSGLNETDVDLTSNTASESTTVLRAVDIAVTKSGPSSSVTAGSGGGNLIYTITATNNGPSNATGVALTDALLAALPSGWSLDSAVGSGSTTFSSGTGVWTVGSLNTGVTETLTVTLTVGSAATVGTVTNSVSLTALDQADSTPANNTATTDTPIARSVDIGLTKTDNVDPVFAGTGADNLVYTITATNSGPSDASGVQISDSLVAGLPAGFSVSTAAGSHGTTFSPTTGIWDVGVIPAGASRLLTLTLTVTDAAAVTSVTNTAQVIQVNETDSSPGNDTATETTQVRRAVDIVLTKSDAVDPVVAGSGAGNLIYTVTAANSGQADATGLQVSDALLTMLPAGISMVSVTGSGGSTFNSATGIWDIGSLAIGDSRELTVVLTVSQLATVSSLTNVVTVSQVDQLDSDLTTNTATETTQILREVDLVVTKTDDADPLRSPGVLTYTIDVANNGQSAATDVVLTDTLSTQVTFVSAHTSQGTVVGSGQVVTADIGLLLPGEAAVVTVVVSVDLPLGGRIENIATVTSTGTDTDPGSNTAAQSTVIDPQLFSVSGLVYQDLNGNGVQDAGEAAVVGVQVGIFGRDGLGDDVLQTATTNAAGQYEFTGLLQGEYHLFEVQPLVYEDGADTPGTGAGSISATNDAFFALNLNTANGSNAVGFNFGEGQIDESKRELLASSTDVDPPPPVDASAAGSLSGRVMVDGNNNGILDAGDTPVFAASVTLAGRRANGQPVLVTARTNTFGEYMFTGLPAGTYSLVEQQPYGLDDGPEQLGTLLAGSVRNDVFAAITLADGATGTGFHFLEREPVQQAAADLQPVVLADGVETSAHPTLSWTAVSGVSTYDVWLSQITDGVGVVYRNTAVSGNALTIPTALSLGVHRMWVRAIDHLGRTGPWSRPVTFDVSPQAEIVAPLVSTVQSSPTVVWHAVDGATLYDVVVQDERGVEVARSTNVVGTSVVVPASLSDGRYTVWVRGRNADVVGHWSDGADFVVTGAPVTLGPTLASVFAAPLLEWTDTGASAYRVWVNDITTTSTKLLETVVSGTSLLMTSGLQGGHRYRYWVQSMDGTVGSEWSAAHTFTVADTTVITSPSGNVSANPPTITWTPFAAATHYDVWVSDASGLFLREPAVTGTSYTFGSSLPDGDYQVWVQPEGAGQFAKWSAPVSFSVGALTQPVITFPQTTTSNRRPTITWDDDPSAVSTEIWINHVGVTNRVIHELAVAGESFTPGFDLAPGTYAIWVRSRSATGVRSEWSAVLRLDVT